MNGHGISEYPAKTRKYGVFTLSFIIVIGMGFCYVDLFTDAGWKSKWYWLYTAVSVCGLSFFLTGAGRPETGKTFRIGLPDCLLAALVLYCLSRAAAGQFAEAFLMRCTAFLPIYCLAGRVVRNRSFEPLSAAVAASALLLALYGIAQYAGLLPAGKTFRVVGNFDNPAGYASMLALSVPFILYFALSGRRRMRYAVGVVCAIVVGAIVLSGSRTGILAVAATGLLYAVRRRSDFLRRTTAWKKIVLAATAVSVAAGLYFIKKESADGRLLIGRCTWEMIREKPLTGHGYRCFEAGYMLRQARYFERNPESGFAPLADNVKHPFNEFLLLTAEFGAVALLLTALWIASLIRAYRKNPNDESHTLATALSAAAALCCFSYPLSYPFTGSIVALAAGGLTAQSRRSCERFRARRASRILAALSSAALLGFTAKEMYYENRWHRVQKTASSDRPPLPEYERLYPFLDKNAYFLYNYAAELNDAGEADKSLEAATACEKMLNDYDVQMLKADAHKKRRDFRRAEACYLLASRMCPGRFMPLYELVNVYDSTNRPDRAQALAAEIADKPVKIPSGLVSAIKIKMRERVGD